MSTAFLHCQNHRQRLQAGGPYAPPASGSFELDPWALRPERLHWHDNLSGKHQTPCDLGLCKRKFKAKTAAPDDCGSMPCFIPIEISNRHRARSRHFPPAFSRGPP